MKKLQLLTEYYGCSYGPGNGPANGTCYSTHCGNDGNEVECDCDCDNYDSQSCCPNASHIPPRDLIITTKHTTKKDPRGQVEPRGLTISESKRYNKMKKSQLKKIIRESIKGLMNEQPYPYGGITTPHWPILGGQIQGGDQCDQNDFVSGYCVQQLSSQVNVSSTWWQNWLAMKSNAFFNTGGGTNCRSLQNNSNNLNLQLIPTQNCPIIFNGYGGVSNNTGNCWTLQQVTIKSAQLDFVNCMKKICGCQGGVLNP